jgi:hypothetical protein
MLLIASASALAEDFCGVGSTPLSARAIGDNVTFSVVALPPDNSLYWRMVRDRSGEKLDPDKSTLTAGEAVKAGERYAYYWDSAHSILWFATRRSLMKLDLTDWKSTKSLSRGTAGYESFEDLPDQFRREIPKVLEKE